MKSKSTNSRHVALGALGALLCALAGVFLVAKPWENLAHDPVTFCPLDRKYARTAVLVDATDSLSVGQVKAIIENINAMRHDLELYEWIGIFIVNEDNLVLPQPVIALCNPGNENTANPLYQNPEMIRLDFENKFSQPIAREMEKLTDLPEQSTSPIMEMISAIALDPNFDSTQKRRLVIVSDMLQNVDGYSQYVTSIQDSSYYEKWKNSDYALKTIQPALLQNVDVSVLYVKRQNASALQTIGHAEFWKRYFKELGGRLKEVRPI